MKTIRFDGPDGHLVLNPYNINSYKWIESKKKLIIWFEGEKREFINPDIAYDFKEQLDEMFE